MRVQEMKTEEVVRKRDAEVKKLLHRLNRLSKDIHRLDPDHHEFDHSLNGLDKAIYQLHGYRIDLAKRLGEILLA